MQLGSRLGILRSRHDLTVEEVAEKLLCSATKISRIETASRRVRARDVRDLCAVYRVLEREQELTELAREARERVWWTEYEDLDLDPYIGLEQDAKAITCFSMYYMPALLQTEDYAWAIIKAVSPMMAPDVRLQRAEARMQRQQLLEDDEAPRYHVLLDEAVLHCRVGGPTVMAAELDKILEEQRRTEATIQVIPFGIGAYAGMDGYFVLLQTEEGSGRQPVVFVEVLNSNKYLERGADIARYRETIDYLRYLTLSPHDSMEHITEIWRTYASGTRSRVRSFSEEVRPRVTGSYKRRRAALKREEAERREREEAERREREEAERREREEAERREREEAERREREEAERREREEAERRKDRRRTAVKALIVGGEIIVTLIREHLFKGTGPGRLF